MSEQSQDRFGIEARTDLDPMMDDEDVPADAPYGFTEETDMTVVRSQRNGENREMSDFDDSTPGALQAGGSDTAPAQPEKPGLTDRAAGAIQATTSAIGSAAGKAGTAGLTKATDLGSAFIALVRRSPIQSVVFFLSLLWLWESTRPNAGRKTKIVTDKLGDVAHQVQDTAGQLGSQVQDKASQLGQSVQDTANQIGQTVQGKANQIGQTVQGKANQIGSQAQGTAQKASGLFQQMLDENPLAVGAMALVLGAALGFAAPETSKEDELMGASRDQLVDKVQESAHEIADKVSVVAGAAITDAQGILETAKGAAGDVLDAGKTAAQQALDKTQNAAHDALDHVKEEAKNQGLPLPE